MVLRAFSAPRLRFAYRGLCTLNSFGVTVCIILFFAVNCQLSTINYFPIITLPHHQIIPIILSLFFALCSYESEVGTMIINSQFNSTHFGVVVLRASSAPRLRFAYRGLCTLNYPKPLKGLLITIVSYSFSHHPANHSLSPFRG